MIETIKKIVKENAFITSGYEDYQAMLGGSSQVLIIKDEELQELLDLLNVEIEDDDDEAF